MLYYALKTLLSAVIIVAVSEIAKRSTTIGALIASLPLTSVLAFIWLYGETHDTARISTLSSEIFWLVIPSAALFLALPLFIRLGWGFWLSLIVAMAVTAACYVGLFWVLQRLAVVR